MASQNKIILIGSVNDQPDMKATNAGDTIAKFTLKVDRPARQDGMQSGFDTIPVVAWQNSADKAKDLSLGDLVYIEGRIQTRNYEDANGVRVYVTEIEARDVQKISAGASIAEQPIAQQEVPKTPVAPTQEPQMAKEEPVAKEVEVSTEPVLEAAPATEEKANFDFTEHSNAEIKESAPAFDTKIEEDIPF